MLRQHHSVALGAAAAARAAQSAAASHYSYGSAGASLRGRGQQRSSNSSSRAASAASSGGPNGARGQLMLDAGSLSVLGAYFDRLMMRIQQQVDYVSSPKGRGNGEANRRDPANVRCSYLLRLRQLPLPNPAARHRLLAAPMLKLPDSRIFFAKSTSWRPNSIRSGILGISSRGLGRGWKGSVAS
jgi:hypothetical protein